MSKSSTNATVKAAGYNSFHRLHFHWLSACWVTYWSCVSGELVHSSLLRILNGCREPHIYAASGSTGGSSMSSALVGFVQNCNVLSRSPFQDVFSS